MLFAMVAMAMMSVVRVTQAQAPPFLLTWGSAGNGTGQFNGPYGIAVDNASAVYVTDNYNHRVQKFTGDGVYVTQWGSHGNTDGQFQNPTAIAVDNQGYVYVLDGGNGRVQKFTNSGTFLSSWGSTIAVNGLFYSPYGLCTDAAGDVYVTDINPPRVERFTGSGLFIQTFGTSGGSGQLVSPYGVGVDQNGQVYVTDAFPGRVVKYSPQGNFEYQWPLGNNERGVGIDSYGHVYVADYSGNQIREFDGSGNPLNQWGAPGSGDGQLNGPVWVAMDASNNVFITDSGNNRVQKFGPSLVSVTSNEWTLMLFPASPNPCYEPTLRFSLPQAGQADLVIYDILGRRLKTWHWSTLAPGPHQVTWDGRTDQGAAIPPGVLFYRLEAGGQALKQKMIHLQ